MKNKIRQKNRTTKNKKILNRSFFYFEYICLTVIIFISLLIIHKFFMPVYKIPQITVMPEDVTKMLNVKKEPVKISARMPILLYHYVEYVKDKGDKIRISLNITPNIFKAQVETLKSAGFTFITPSLFADYLSGKISDLPDKPVIISFDDGYRDFYTDVFPILLKEQVKAVIYIVPNFLNRPNYLLTGQLEEIAKSRLVEIGAHTMNHTWLKGLSEEKAKYEINKSKDELENLLHIQVNSFAYPYGAFDLKTIDLVKKAGFTNAVTTVPGIKDSEDTKYFLFRIRPGHRIDKELLDYLLQDTFKAW